MVYAKIDNGVVVNILEIAPHNAKDYPDCVLIDDRPVQIGDIYADGVFTRDGVVIKNAMERMADIKLEKQRVSTILNIILGEDERV